MGILSSVAMPFPDAPVRQVAETLTDYNTKRSSARSSRAGSEAKPTSAMPWHKFPMAIFVGCYTQRCQADPYGVPHNEDPVGTGIQILQMSPSGEMIFMCESINAGINPSFMTFDSTNKTLYVSNETADFEGQAGTGGITAFSVDLTDQANPLTKLNSVASYGEHTCHMSVDATDSVLCAANYSSGSVSAFRLQEDGSVGAQVGWKVHDYKDYQFGDPQRQEGAHAHSCVFDPDNQRMLVCDLGMDKIITYDFARANHAILPGCTTYDDRLFDPTLGKELLRATGVEFVADPCSGPRHLVFHPNGDFVYSINELSATIDAHIYDRVNGALLRQSAVKMLPPSWPDCASRPEVAHMNHGRWAADIKIHPNGRFLYASNRLHNTIVSYEIQPDGSLAYLAHQDTLGETPRNFCFSPDARFIVVAHMHSHDIVSFHVDGSSGALRPTGFKLQCPCASFVSILRGPQIPGQPAHAVVMPEELPTNTKIAKSAACKSAMSMWMM